MIMTMRRIYSADKLHKRLRSNPRQPRRSRAELKEIALEELRRRGLSRRIKVKIANPYGAPRARAQYIRRGNIIKLHPINRFCLKDDIRKTVRHEITRYNDEIKGTSRAKEY